MDSGLLRGSWDPEEPSLRFMLAREDFLAGMYLKYPY